MISKTCNNYLTVYLDPQSIANSKVWNNNKIHWSVVASDLVQVISYCLRRQVNSKLLHVFEINSWFPPRAVTFSGGGIAYLNDPDSYAGWSLYSW